MARFSSFFPNVLLATMISLSGRIADRLRGAINALAFVSFRVALTLLELARRKRTGSPQFPKSADADGNNPSMIFTTEIESVDRQAPALRQAGDFSDCMPIIFIHRSNSEHLKYALRQACKSNPDSRIYLLGDTSNNVHDLIEHRLYSDYFDGASQFAHLYKHFSTHGVDFELICFQRWFILRDFLAANRLNAALYLDSDVLLYANVTQDRKKFNRFDFTLCWRTIGCVFFLNRLQGLEHFCQFLLDLYGGRLPYYYDRMVSHYATRQKHHLSGGVCDMTALELYNELHFGDVGEASQIIDSSIYDPNINMPQPGFQMSNGIKKVFWKNDQPWGRTLATGEEIRFNSLHFNGRAKAIMKNYCTATL